MISPPVVISSPLINGPRDDTLNSLETAWTCGQLGSEVSRQRLAIQTERMLSELMSETNQEPSDLLGHTVDMTQRFESVLTRENHRFYVGSIVMSLVLAIAYICLPCEVPMNYYLFLFTHRALYNMFASLLQSSMAALFLRKKFTFAEIAFILILYNTYDLLVQYFWYSLGLDSWGFITVLVGILVNAGNWLFMVVSFFVWAWPHADATVLIQFTCLVMTFYIYLSGLFIIWAQISAGLKVNTVIDSIFFAIFFAWNTLCHRVLQSLSRRVAIGIARVEGRPVQWYNLLRSQCFLFMAYATQGATYRLIFQKISRVEVQIVLIAMHILQEVLLYPVRLFPRVREWERKFLSRSRIGRQILSPVLPMSVWIDVHYLDFFLKKVADLATLVLFVARIVLCRYASWISDCYTPKTWTSEFFFELLELSGPVFVSEMASGLISLYFFRSIGRNFVIRAVASSRQLMVLFCICIVVTTCGVTYGDSTKYVIF